MPATAPLPLVASLVTRIALRPRVDAVSDPTPTAIPAATGTADKKTPATAVRGGWVNDLSCVPRGLSATDDPAAFGIECSGSSLWDGDFLGRTILHLHGTIALSGRMEGTYDEVLFGTYAGDHSHGALHTHGYFVVDENAAFLARATIVNGTCDWAGSTGTMAYDGFSTNGGYVGEWVRPSTTPADPACNPVDSIP